MIEDTKEIVERLRIVPQALHQRRNGANSEGKMKTIFAMAALAAFFDERKDRNALLAVPLLASFKIICEREEPLHPIAEFLTT